MDDELQKLHTALDRLKDRMDASPSFREVVWMTIALSGWGLAACLIIF